MNIELNLNQVRKLGNNYKLCLIKDACHDVFVSHHNDILKEATDNLINFLKS